MHWERSSLTDLVFHHINDTENSSGISLNATSFWMVQLKITSVLLAYTSSHIVHSH